MSVSLTKEQSAAISARGKVIVSASAGSGKTFVMIERLVSLIADEGIDIKSVLCVTFTNKAAAQMRDRLRSALLKKISSASDISVRKHLKEQLSDLPLADICTIHAFCGRLLRSRFYQADIDPAFRIIASDDGTGKEISRRALDETFEAAYEENGEEFKELLAVWFYKKKDKRLRSLVLGLHDKANSNADCIQTLSRVGAEDHFEEACAVILSSFQERAGYYYDCAVYAQKYFEGKNARAVKAAGEIISACEEVLNAQDLFALSTLEKCAISSMPGSNLMKSDEDRAVLKRLSNASKGIKGLYSDFADFSSREEEKERCASACKRASYLARLAIRYDTIYERMKKEKGVLDYDDLERYALKILADEDTQKELREKYRYIFVDEYQDVNPVQEEIISRISGDEVFLVGDSKQAIYGFRGSHSEFFTKKMKELNVLQLTRNFRSATGVLDCVNRVFESIIEGYEPMTGGDRYEGHTGEVAFHYIPEKEKEKPIRGVYSVAKSVAVDESDALSDEVLRLIESEHGKLFFDADLGKERSVEWGDIAVLARKKDGAAERIVRAAVERNIPVTTSSKINVCEFFEARLLIDWLSLLDNARQDIPLGTAMLSEIGSFTNAELAEIRLRFPAPYTFRDACEKYRRQEDEGISPIIKQKLQNFYTVYENLRALSRVQSASEMMNALLASGLETQIAKKGNVKTRLAHVQRLIAEAGEENVHEFLAHLNALGNRVEYSESGGENAVKVHTMHASKGLEYPVVILAGLDSSFHGLERDEIMWTDKFLAVPKSYDLLKKTYGENVLRMASQIVQEKIQLEEEKNLLYVAMTRAQYRLHMLFAGKESNPPQFANRFSDFLDLNAMAGYFVEGEEIKRAEERHALATRPDMALKDEILSIYCRPYAHQTATALRVKSSATELMREEKTEISYPVRKGFAVEEGLAYHAFLQHVHFGRGVQEELKRMLLAGEITKEQAEVLNGEQLEKILSMPVFASLEGKRIWREQNFLMSLPAREMSDIDCDDEIIFQGAIDLLVEDENGFTVIDYKYSGREDSDIAQKYAVQVKLYKKAVAKIMRVKEENVLTRIVNIASCREIVL